VIADGKRGDVPHTAAVYAQAMFDGLGADAVTVNPLLGADALEPWLVAAAASGAGVFALVRTSNPGATDVLDLPTDRGPVHERIAALVGERAPRLAGARGLSGMGAVVGATEPRHLGHLRELMPDSIFLVPGVGAQGGRPSALGPAFSDQPASVLVPASRSIATAADPAAAAAELRDEVWAAAQIAAR
jgi:orotidine-5'-phosphate decarboxylase